jgi:hypothetical protein
LQDDVKLCTAVVLQAVQITATGLEERNNKSPAAGGLLLAEQGCSSCGWSAHAVTVRGVLRPYLQSFRKFLQVLGASSTYRSITISPLLVSSSTAMAASAAATAASAVVGLLRCLTQGGKLE